MEFDYQEVSEKLPEMIQIHFNKKIKVSRSDKYYPLRYVAGDKLTIQAVKFGTRLEDSLLLVPIANGEWGGEIEAAMVIKLNSEFEHHNEVDQSKLWSGVVHFLRENFDVVIYSSLKEFKSKNSELYRLEKILQSREDLKNTLDSVGLEEDKAIEILKWLQTMDYVVSEGNQRVIEEFLEKMEVQKQLKAFSG